ncbi:BA75_05221T0 [Komagataella pastoris]|uniref:BA75_05221T0 n=1 Tax=Komagataella pastoris TaxID=4922 RepID=A0A1B2JIL5_PICPA|nr:BA75_05221T0 [Komagataella pastoris]
MILVELENVLFKRANGSVSQISSKGLLFKNQISLKLDSDKRWAIIGSTKSSFLEVLAGKHQAVPIEGRKYPALANELASQSIELLQFSNNNYGKSATGAGNGGFTHLGARYEFFKDLEIDIRADQFISDYSYNASRKVDTDKIVNLIKKFKLDGLEDKYINGLSNGQFRRARLAKSIYKAPRILLIDDPFLGLDPNATDLVSNVLSQDHASAIVLGLRIQDPIPSWIDNVVLVNQDGVVKHGPKDALAPELEATLDDFKKSQIKELENIKKKKLAFIKRQAVSTDSSEIISMRNVNVAHKGKKILTNLNWNVRCGEKWHIRGPNGSGKTTILSLITLDHPQSWNKSISVYGTPRRVGSTNYFDTNKYIGFTSPELHALFPKKLTVFKAVSTGFVTGSYLPPIDLTADQVDKINNLLDYFQLGELKDTPFDELSISHQKVVLFIRAVINDPRILILDESLSAMNENDVLRCKDFVSSYNQGCVLVVGHVDEEVPECDKFLQLIDAPNGEYRIGYV